MSRLDTLKALDLSYKEMNFVIEYSKDFDAARAAMMSGYKRSDSTNLMGLPRIVRALDAILTDRLEASDIDANWVLMEAVDNHRLARAKGNLPASNAALMIIAKHKAVGAHTPEQEDQSKQLTINIDGKLMNV